MAGLQFFTEYRPLYHPCACQTQLVSQVHADLNLGRVLHAGNIGQVEEPKHTHTPPTHALLSHVLAGYSIMRLLLQGQLETLPPQWWPSPLATLSNPGRNLKPTFWVSEGFFFQNKSQHWSWIKYSKLFYHAALQKSPQVRL